MAFSHLVTNTVRVARLAGFQDADTRRPIEDQPDQGRNRLFEVAADAITEVMPWHAISADRRQAIITVKVAYWRGGGDAGGENGGDRLSVNCRAANDMLTLAAMLENPNNYDSQVTGINRILLREFTRIVDKPLAEVWQLALTCEWEQSESAQAVPA